MRYSLIIILLCIATMSFGQFLDKAKEQVEEEVEQKKSGQAPSEEEAIEGLKDALKVGIKKGAKKVSKVNGYYKNPEIKIPFPPDVKDVKQRVEKMGMEEQVHKVVKKLNRAAEDAANEAKPIFVDAITNMSIGDAKKILKGADTAATHYLRNTTHQQLYEAFKPEIEESLQEVNATRYWDEIISAYNEVPMVEDKNPDLADYTTKRALKGLFLMVSKEEKKIRDDPAARVTDILEKVFDYYGND